MKTATAFLVAVTVFASVFLETSAAPNPLFGTIASNVGASLEGVGKVVGNKITEVGQAVDKVAVNVGQTVDGVANVIVKKALKDIDTVIQNAVKILSGLEATIGKVTQAATALGGEIGEKLNEALIKVPSTSKKLIELAEKLDKAVAEGADDTVKELEGLIKIVVAKLKEDVAGVIVILDKISEKAGKDVALVITTVKGFLAKFDEVVEGILSKVAEVHKSKTTKVVESAKKLDGEALVDYVENEIKTCEEALAALNKYVEEYLATATDEQKKIVAAVVEFLKKFGMMVNGIHEELREAVKDIDREILEKVIEKILEAIKNTEVQVNELQKTQVDEIKEALEKYCLGIIVGEAKKLVIVAKNHLE